MRIENYPPQEPFSEAGDKYAAEVMRRGQGTSGEDHSYGDDPYQSLSLHIPENPDGTILAFVHGGGWTSGYKEHMDFMAPPMLDAGIIFISIGYRLAPQHNFPTGVNDIAAALATIYQRIEKFGGNPERIFVGGHSAGGHYTALLAVRNDWQAKHNVPTTIIRGCVPISGVYNFAEGNGMAARPRFLGEADAEIAASPLYNIQQTPPFLLAHGSVDFPHLVAQATEMEKALKAADADVSRIVFEGRNHFTASYAGGEADGPWVPEVIKWMGTH
jgi:arylformamidase|tara:strand:- start:134 stop:952 length:819 start_codon:yes stop_codon:yes gene_type:complete